MNRLNKLDTEVELEILPNQQQQQQQSYNGYEHYGSVKEYYCGSKRENCGETDDQFMRPPLWEDITSSIQNIDPENAIMLSALTGATQVKLESSDDTFLESLSSPLLSPLEIKTEKNFYNNNVIHQSQLSQHINNGNNSHDSYSVQPNYHQNSNNQNHPQVHHPNQLNGFQDFNLHHHGGHVPHPQYSNNYYNWQQTATSHQAPIYGNKFTPQSNLCAPISRLMYAPPLTPPSSDPGSPGNNIQVSFATNLVAWFNKEIDLNFPRLIYEGRRLLLITFNSSNITCRTSQSIPRRTTTTTINHRLTNNISRSSTMERRVTATTTWAASRVKTEIEAVK